MRNNIYILLIMTIIFNSCSEIIEIDLNSEENSKLVIEGSITTEQKNHKVKLSWTSDYFSNQAPRIELNAIVSISDGENIYLLTDDDNDGIYITDVNVQGEVDKTYSLDVELESGEQYFAESYLKEIYPMDSLNYIYKKSEIPFDDKYNYEVNIFVQEPETEGDFYQWELYIDGIHDSDTLSNKNFESDLIYNGEYLGPWPVYVIPDYKITNDTTVIKIQMLSMSKEEYDFKLAILFETEFSGSPFSGPPANVPSNISSNAIGFFSASDVVEDSVEVYFRRNAE